MIVEPNLHDVSRHQLVAEPSFDVLRRQLVAELRLLRFHEEFYVSMLEISVGDEQIDSAGARSSGDDRQDQKVECIRDVSWSPRWRPGEQRACTHTQPSTRRTRVGDSNAPVDMLDERTGVE